MSRPLARLMLCWLVAVPASCLAEDAAAPGDTPDWQLSTSEWRQRIDEARRRTEAFIADAQSRKTESPASVPVLDELAKAIDERLMNDDNLRRGDIIATSKGLFMLTGRTDPPRTPDDFQPFSPINPADKAGK